MDNPLRSARPVDQEMTGLPVEAHGYVVTPVARVRGRLGSMDDEQGSGRYGWAAIRPVKVAVLDRNGNTKEVRITNAQTQAFTVMAAIGFVIAVMSVLTTLLGRTRHA